MREDPGRAPPRVEVEKGRPPRFPPRLIPPPEPEGRREPLLRVDDLDRKAPAEGVAAARLAVQAVGLAAAIDVGIGSVGGASRLARFGVRGGFAARSDGRLEPTSGLEWLTCSLRVRWKV